MGTELGWICVLKYQIKKHNQKSNSSRKWYRQQMYFLNPKCSLLEKSPCFSELVCWLYVTVAALKINNGLQQAEQADCSPPGEFKTSCLLSSKAASPTVFNFTFMEFDFCQPVICHPYCPHHQFSDSFINCYLSYTHFLY